MKNSKNDVMVIAIWSNGLGNVYDAYEVARWLGYQNSSCFDPRRDRHKQLDNHVDEYLVANGILADEYRGLGHLSWPHAY